MKALILFAMMLLICDSADAGRARLHKPSWQGSYNGERAETNGRWGTARWRWTEGAKVGGQGGYWDRTFYKEGKRARKKTGK